MTPRAILRRWRPLAIAATLALTPPAVPAVAQDYAGSSFASYLQLLAARARGEGVSERAIANVTAGLT